MRAIRIGTRGSPLALWQANAVAAAIAERDGPATELVIIRTSGDRLQNRPLAEEGGKRLFVKEIEDALLDGRIDIAIHSAKDLPADRLPGLTVSAVLRRADPHDVVVTGSARRRLPDRAAPRGAQTPAADILATPNLRVGTGSIRRTAQLLHAYPLLDIAPIRGNVGTRLRKLNDGDHDALILAGAGLERLGLAQGNAAQLPFELCLPAPGQGILAAEYRTGDDATGAMIRQLAHPDTTAALTAERTLVQALGADCHTPLGAIATLDGAGLHLRALVASPDGSRLVQHEAHASPDEAHTLGAEVAEALLKNGAAHVLGATTPTRPASTSAPVSGPTSSPALRSAQGPPVSRPASGRETTSPRTEYRPLAGRRVLITRPRGQADDFAAALRALGGDPVVVPMIEIAPPEDDRPLVDVCAAASSFDWIVFTSANGADAVMSRLPRRDRPLDDTRVVAVGPATAARLASHGVAVDLVPAEHRAEAAAAELITAHDLTGARVLLPRASLATPELPDALRAAGADVTDVVAYRTVPATGTGDVDLAGMLERGELDVVTFTSPSAVRTLAALLGGPERAASLLANTLVASIGPVTTTALRTLDLTADITPDRATVPALVDAIAQRCG